MHGVVVVAHDEPRIPVMNDRQAEPCASESTLSAPSRARPARLNGACKTETRKKSLCRARSNVGKEVARSEHQSSARCTHNTIGNISSRSPDSSSRCGWLQALVGAREGRK